MRCLMNARRLLLGLDVGSSSIKAALLDADTGRMVAHTHSPAAELPIDAPQPGWAEQHPELWWEHVRQAVRELRVENNRLDEVAAVGISYQMHGLVMVDREGAVIRPSIIWCDGRAIESGWRMEEQLGSDWCSEHLLNTPGNFTAAKLAWIKEREPKSFDRIAKVLLPGDWIAGKLTGEWTTTPSGLSEGIFWDYVTDTPAAEVLGLLGISEDMLGAIVPSFSSDLRLSRIAAEQLGLPAGIPVSYRAGDQPNNAFSLQVLEPGEVAATAGTSGVIYSVSKDERNDARGRVNTFLHVTDRGRSARRLGNLLCVNGAGSLYAWLRKSLSPYASLTYDSMSLGASEIPIGAEGLQIYPFGNGPERVLDNRDPGASITGLRFATHDYRHMVRAAIEGIVFTLGTGLETMRELGTMPKLVRAGRANLFQSELFRTAFVSVTGCPLELLQTDGAEGAARAAGLGCGEFKNTAEAFRGLARIATIEPEARTVAEYQDAFQSWSRKLQKVS